MGLSAMISMPTSASLGGHGIDLVGRRPRSYPVQIQLADGLQTGQRDRAAHVDHADIGDEADGCESRAEAFGAQW